MPRVSFTLYSLATGAPLSGIPGVQVISCTRINRDGSSAALALPTVAEPVPSLNDGTYYFDIPDSSLPAGSGAVVRGVIDCGALASARYEDFERFADPLPVAAADEDEAGDDGSGSLPGALWTWAEANALKAAIATGVMTVTYSGPPTRTVTYQSIGAMRALLAEMIAYLTAETRQSVRFATTRKGFG